jgi:hypothetical protein
MKDYDEQQSNGMATDCAAQVATTDLGHYFEQSPQTLVFYHWIDSVTKEETIMRVTSCNHSLASGVSSCKESSSIATTVQQGKAPFQRMPPKVQSLPRMPRKSTRNVENYKQIALDQVISSLKRAQYHPLLFVKTTLETIPEGSEELESPR